MTKWLKPSILASILAGVVCGIGCSPLSFMSFLGPEPSVPAELHALTVKDKKEPVKVAILTYKGFEVREEFLNADRKLTDLLIKQLKSLAELNGDKVEFINIRKVVEYTSSHPHWQEDLDEAGKDLKADFVIYLEINSLSMYDKGNRELYKGRANINVSLHRVGDVDDVPQQKEYRAVYPTVRMVPADMDMEPSQFREEFLNYVAKRVSWYFMAHPTSSTYMDDE